MQQVGSHLIMYTKDLKSFTILTNTRMERGDVRLTSGILAAAHYILILNTHCQLQKVTYPQHETWTEYLHLLYAPVHWQKSNICNINASIPIFGSNSEVTEGCDHLGVFAWSLLN